MQKSKKDKCNINTRVTVAFLDLKLSHNLPGTKHVFQTTTKQTLCFDWSFNLFWILSWNVDLIMDRFIKLVNGPIILTLKGGWTSGLKNNYIFIYACVCKNYTCGPVDSVLLVSNNAYICVVVDDLIDKNIFVWYID